MGEIFQTPYDVIFSHSLLQYVEPDLVYVSSERSAIVMEQNIQGVPDLVVEILSPPTSLRDRQEKHSLYERFGVPEYWIVDPEMETVQVFRLVDGHYPVGLELCKTDILESPRLPGLSIRLSAVFSS
ncbi:MAG: Uma2 family endonuclease [Nitrospirae bacterium]|nr:Uma2 family endonuclease [Nitrospirota bacterium]